METVTDEVKMATQQPESKESLINALKEDFATTVNKIYINKNKKIKITLKIIIIRVF